MVCFKLFFSGTFWNAAFLVQGPMIRLTSLVAIVYLENIVHMSYN
jgi:hypothetical protein